MFGKLKILGSILLEFTNANRTICSVNKGVVSVIFGKNNRDGNPYYNIKNPENAKILLQLVRKLGEQGKILNKQEQEDFLLGKIISEEKTGKTVSRDTIMKKLKK
jgi:hypothetical protein